MILPINDWIPATIFCRQMSCRRDFLTVWRKLLDTPRPVEPLAGWVYGGDAEADLLFLPNWKDAIDFAKRMLKLDDDGWQSLRELTDCVLAGEDWRGCLAGMAEIIFYTPKDSDAICLMCCKQVYRPPTYCVCGASEDAEEVRD